MENLRIENHIKWEKGWYPMWAVNIELDGKFEYLMYIKTLENTKIWSSSPIQLLAWNIPAFSLN